MLAAYGAWHIDCGEFAGESDSNGNGLTDCDELKLGVSWGVLRVNFFVYVLLYFANLYEIYLPFLYVQTANPVSFVVDWSMIAKSDIMTVWEFAGAQK